MAEGGQKRDPVTHRTKAQRARSNKKHGTTPKAKKDRAARNKARRILMKAGVVKKGGPDVHHVDGNPRNNSRSNLKSSSTKKNRNTNGKR